MAEYEASSGPIGRYWQYVEGVIGEEMWLKIQVFDAPTADALLCGLGVIPFHQSHAWADHHQRLLDDREGVDVKFIDVDRRGSYGASGAVESEDEDV